MALAQHRFQDETPASRVSFEHRQVLDDVRECREGGLDDEAVDAWQQQFVNTQASHRYFAQ